MEQRMTANRLDYVPVTLKMFCVEGHSNDTFYYIRKLYRVSFDMLSAGGVGFLL